MTDRLKGRVAVVSGSGQGIGREIAIALAREGASVVTNNRQPGTPGGDAETTAGHIRDNGGRAAAFFGDISKYEIARQFIQTAVKSFGKLDILVNNAAGADTRRMLWELTREDWDATIATHLTGSFNCVSHAAGIMREQKFGRILSATSSARLGLIESCHYSAATAGVLGFTRAVALELGRYGITSNAYAPAARTRRTAGEKEEARYRRAYEAGVYNEEEYRKRLNMPDPNTVAPLIAYLCTDEASDINGQVFSVVGGSIAVYHLPVKGKTITKEDGLWGIDELTRLVPGIMPPGYKNPAPAKPS